MKSLKLALAAAALAFFVIACGDAANTNQTANTNARPANAATPAAAAPTATPDELARASGDFSQFCIRCHKADGTGGVAELDEGKTLKVPNLREHGLKDSDEELAEQIRDGGDGMPAFKNRLDEQRINNLVRFVRRDFHGRSTSAPAGSTSPSPAR